MKINLKNYITKISIIGLAMLVITVLIMIVFPKFYISAHFLTVFIFWLTTILFYLVIKKNLRNEKVMNFVNIFMGATVAKLFLLMIYIIIYIFSVKENLVTFLIFVLINYAIFTFFEVVFLLKNQKTII